MDDMNDNLGDFLRKKLTEFDGANDGWDKPDASVWAQAQQQIPVASKPSLIGGKVLLASAVVLLLLLVGGYIWSLQQEIGDLKMALKTEATQVQAANERLVISENKHSKEQSVAQSEQDKLKMESDLVLEQNNKLERLSFQQKQAIFNLSNENITLQNALNNQMTVQAGEDISLDYKSALAESSEQTATILGNQNIALLPQKQTEFPRSAIPNFNISAPIIPAKARHGQFEVGYEYALLGMKIPVQSDFEDKGSATNNAVNKAVFTHSNGLFFAFSPKPNWFIRMGLRTAHLSLEQYQKSGVYYDKTGEYHKPDGTTFNDLSLSSRTAYNELESEITLAIPSDANLKTGDWVAFTTYERLQQRYFQVPIGLEYYHGNGRLQLQFQSGGQWNKVVFDDYLLKAWAETKSQGVPVDKVKVLTKDIPSKQFISVYAGIGLNYQLTDHWHARAGIIYNYDFINHKNTGLSNSQLIGNAFKFGLNYRF